MWRGPNLVSWDGVPAAAAAYYVGDMSYDNPYISPIFGDFTGFPPTYLISGTRDLMLSDTVRTHRKLRRAGARMASAAAASWRGQVRAAASTPWIKAGSIRPASSYQAAW